MSYALRTLYSIRKSKEAAGLVGHTWAQTNVSELDSMLNKWFDMIPDHRESSDPLWSNKLIFFAVRWDPNRPYDSFFDQSALLYIVYYNTQIQIHRPFIHKSSSLSFPSLVICTNAAKACARVLEVQKQKGHLMIFGIGVSLLVLLVIFRLTSLADGSLCIRHCPDNEYVDREEVRFPFSETEGHRRKHPEMSEGPGGFLETVSPIIHL